MNELGTHFSEPSCKAWHPHQPLDDKWTVPECPAPMLITLKYQLFMRIKKKLGALINFSIPGVYRYISFLSIAEMAGSVERPGKKSIHHFHVLHGLTTSGLSYQAIVEWVPSKFSWEMRHEIQISLYCILLSYQNYNAVLSSIYRGVAFRLDMWTLQSRPEGFFSEWQLNSQTWLSAMSGSVIFESIDVNLCPNACRFVLFIFLCSYRVCLFL